MTPYLSDEGARIADAVAKVDHEKTPATAGHEALARAMWRAVRALGAGLDPGGQSITIGLEAEVFAGVPAAERLLPRHQVAALVDTIPTTGEWPHTTTCPVPLDTLDDGVHIKSDVFIANSLHTDVDLHAPEARAARLGRDTELLLTGIGSVRPGGLIVGVISSDWLDHPRRDFRDLVGGHAALLGALRLPAGALRRQPGCDRPVDLVLLRTPDRQVPAGPVGEPFGTVFTTSVDGYDVEINGYFHRRPDHVLGALSSERTLWEIVPRLTVLPGTTPWTEALDSKLSMITERAQNRGWGLPPLPVPRPSPVLDLDSPVGYVPTDKATPDATPRAYDPRLVEPEAPPPPDAGPRRDSRGPDAAPPGL